MTELEAVNTLLAMIGEAPIDQLSTTAANEITESTVARQTLAEVSRDVQAEGFSWNTDTNVQLSPMGSQFTVPSNHLRVTFDPRRYNPLPYVVRGNRIYDKTKQTYNLIGVPSLTIQAMVMLLPWDELPHQAQQYITIRAGRIFGSRFVNSNAIYAYSIQDEEYARVMLMRAEESGPRHNFLWGDDGRGSSFQPSEGLLWRD
jgi:hypothetical protein